MGSGQIREPEGASGDRSVSSAGIDSDHRDSDQTIFTGNGGKDSETACGTWGEPDAGERGEVWLSGSGR